MNFDLGDLLEVVGLGLLVAAVWLATGLAWATVLVVAVALLYLSHAWVWEDAPAAAEPVEQPKPASVPLPPHPPGTTPIVSNRRAM